MPFLTRLREVLLAEWPERFLPMPDRRERVSAIVHHHALLAELRERAAAAAGTVSPRDMARWVESVVRYTRAVRTVTALRAIREAGATYHMHEGGMMELYRGPVTTAELSEQQIAKALRGMEAALTHFFDGLQECVGEWEPGEGEPTLQQIRASLQRLLELAVRRPAEAPAEGAGPARAEVIAGGFNLLGYHLVSAANGRMGAG
jgi:hypothetical protein